MSFSIALPAVLNEAAVMHAQPQLLASMREAPASTVIVLDAAGVQSFDSAGLALLLALRRSAQAQGRTLQVKAWPASLKALAQVYGVTSLLDPDAAPAPSLIV